MAASSKWKSITAARQRSPSQLRIAPSPPLVPAHRVYDFARPTVYAPWTRRHTESTHLVSNYRGMLCACRKPRAGRSFELNDLAQEKESSARERAHARLSGTRAYLRAYRLFGRFRTRAFLWRLLTYVAERVAMHYRGALFCSRCSGIKSGLHDVIHTSLWFQAAKRPSQRLCWNLYFIGRVSIFSNSFNWIINEITKSDKKFIP